MNSTAENTNCLEGMRCPKCQHNSSFDIDVMMKVTVYDDGTEEHEGDTLWDEESPCACGGCGHSGKVADFSEN